MDENKSKALAAALSQIEKQFGKGSVMRMDSEAIKDVQVVSTGSLGLDLALGVGGLPRGRVVEIYGPESSGKTTLALHAVAEAQKKGGVAAYIDAEHALDPIYARKLGVDIGELLISQPDTGEQALEITDTLVRSGGVDIVVATPGRLIDLLDRGACTLGQIEITVLDEADHMADLGFLPAVTRLLDQTPPAGQRLLFSATLDRDVDRLVTNYLSTPALHAVAPVADAAAAQHQVFILPAAGKVAVAAEIASRPARTLFFVRTKHGAARLARQLTQAGTPAAAIHGNLNQNQRQRALDGFAAGHPRVLVATDVAARGLHIDDVGLVVHYDPPNDHKDYLHRSGRTARAGASGTVVALVDPGQAHDVARLHSAAGIVPTRHHGEAAHPVVRETPPPGTPTPPPAGAGTEPWGRAPPPRAAGAPPRGRRPPRGGGGADRGQGRSPPLSGVSLRARACSRRAGCLLRGRGSWQTRSGGWWRCHHRTGRSRSHRDLPSALG